MNLLVAAVDRYPGVLVVVLIVAILLVLFAVSDLFVGLAEREEPRAKAPRC